ncbi:MAG: methyltransferase domain-containing protein [Candidatus Bathyarchaeia archaeon]
MISFDLALVRKHMRQVVLDYCEYSGISYEETVKLINKGSKLARDEWVEIVKHGSDEEIFEFYTKSKYYIYEVLQPYLEPEKYSKDINYLKILRFAESTLKKKGCCRVLDFGGGVGELCIFLAKVGCNVTYSDLPGKVSEFAKWRFCNRNISIKQLSSRIDGLELPAYEYDLIVSDAVIEHLNRKYLGNFVQAFARALVDGGYIYLLWDPTYNKEYPYHILGMRIRELDKVMRKYSLIRITDCLYVKSINLGVLLRHYLWHFKVPYTKAHNLAKKLVDAIKC